MDKIKLEDITLQEETAPELPDAADFDPGQVAPGREITMHFELSLDNGDCIDSNFDASPVCFTLGDGNLLPGFEQAILGLRSGDEETVTVPAARAFGEHNPANIQKFPRYRFPADLAMECGLMINFADSAGNDQPGIIRSFDSSRVEVDFNHPLAGRDILFRVKVLGVSAPGQG